MTTVPMLSASSVKYNPRRVTHSPESPPLPLRSSAAHFTLLTVFVLPSSSSSPLLRSCLRLARGNLVKLDRKFYSGDDFRPGR